jgi:hypothetical protein
LSEEGRIVEEITTISEAWRSLVCRLHHAWTHPIDGGA